jgi:hypothetical protein
MPRWGHTSHIQDNTDRLITFGGRVKHATKSGGNYFAAPLLSFSLGMVQPHPSHARSSVLLELTFPKTSARPLHRSSACRGAATRTG